MNIFYPITQPLNRLHSILQNKGEFFSFLVLSAITFFVGLLFSFLIVAKPGDWNTIKDALHYETGSTLYGINREGNFEAIAEFYSFKRDLLSPQFFKKHPNNKVARAFIAMEDMNFASHFGLDLKGIVRAFFVNILAGRIKEGASTITQQAARLKFLTFERSYIRKAREAWLAILMERYYSKSQIIQMYLNEVPLGHGNLGVKAAARFYFDKDVANLSWGEAALLASLTTRPNIYSPLKNIHLSISKVKVVFRKLVESGELNVTQAEKEWKALEKYYKTLNRSPLESAFSYRLNKFPWFSEYIRRFLEKKYGKKRLYRGGLKIYSTIDINMQAAAQQTIRTGTKRQSKISSRRIFKKVELFDKRYGSAWNLASLALGLPDLSTKMRRRERDWNKTFQKSLRNKLSLLSFSSGSANLNLAIEAHYKNYKKIDSIQNVEGALVTLEVPSGRIKALVGGSEFKAGNQLIRAVDAYRQPGSSFKPLVYGSAIEYSGLHPDSDKIVTASSLFNDTPKIFLMTDGDEWTPENYSANYEGFMRLRRALELSKNMVAIQIPEYIGLKNIHPILEKMIHIKDRTRRSLAKSIPYNYSIALGSFAFSPLEMARAYTMFPGRGLSSHPYAIIKVTDRKGNILDDFEKKIKELEPDRVIMEGTAKIMTSMMQGVIEKGTATAIRKVGFKRPAAGKTGTTDNQRDAWFVGFTPHYVTAIWIGYDNPNLTLGPHSTGGGTAAPLWGKYMLKALKGKKVNNFSFPGANVVSMKVCKESGEKATSACESTYSELFLSGTEPTKDCSVHSGSGFVKEESEGIKIVNPKKSNLKTNSDILKIDESLE